MNKLMFAAAIAESIAYCLPVIAFMNSEPAMKKQGKASNKIRNNGKSRVQDWVAHLGQVRGKTGLERNIAL